MPNKSDGHYVQFLKYEKENTIKIAKELFYNQDTIEKLKNAKSTGELSRIMNNARKGAI